MGFTPLLHRQTSIAGAVRPRPEGRLRDLHLGRSLGQSATRVFWLRSRVGFAPSVDVQNSRMKIPGKSPSGDVRRNIDILAICSGTKKKLFKQGQHAQRLAQHPSRGE